MIASNWYKTNMISDHIYCIDDNGGSNIYLIIGSKKALLIDTGWGIGNLRELVSSITDLPLMVVNTHGHPDHVSGGYLFADIHIEEKDVSILEGCFKKDNREWAYKNVLNGPFPDAFNCQRWINETVDRVIPIKDGHTFDLGNKVIEVVSIPGHSPGSIGLIDKNEKVLFSGDSILKGHIWLQLDHSLTLSKFLDSLKIIKFRSKDFDKILPAHGSTPLNTEIIHELVNGVEDILLGKRKGTYHETFAGNGLICRFNTCSIVYKDNQS